MTKKKKGLAIKNKRNYLFAGIFIKTGAISI